MEYLVVISRVLIFSIGGASGKHENLTTTTTEKNTNKQTTLKHHQNPLKHRTPLQNPTITIKNTHQKI